MEPFFADTSWLIPWGEDSMTDDVWDKFDIYPTPSQSPSYVRDEVDDEWSLVGVPCRLGEDHYTEKWTELRHDCMWGGHCCGDVHTRRRVISFGDFDDEFETSTTCPNRPFTPSIYDEIVKEETSAVAVHTDHSYHAFIKPRRDVRTLDRLGIDTPSDSEDDIDVVNVDKRKSANAKQKKNIIGRGRSILLKNALPSKPSSSTRRHLRHLAAAVLSRKVEDESQVPDTVAAHETVRVTPPHSRRRAVKKASPRKLHDADGLPLDRAVHNDMERLRRIELKKSFGDLQTLLLDHNGQQNKMMPKVQILQKAAECCESLTKESSRLLEVLRQQKQLKRELSLQLERLKRV